MCFFVFKQKTAYEVRIRDWSSDVCSSDLLVRQRGARAFEALLDEAEPLATRRWKHELAAEKLDTPEQRAGLRQRLTERADTCAYRYVRHEYLADLRRLFDDQFTPPRRQFGSNRPFVPGQRKNGRWVPPPLPVTHQAKAVHAQGIDPILARAVLVGLIRHPAEIARHVEVLGSLRLAGGALGRLFEAVVELALEDQALDSANLLTILAKSGFDSVAGDLLRADTIDRKSTRLNS